MKQGAVIFAFDNEKVCYRDLAVWSAARIQNHLDLPVTLITDSPMHKKHHFDQVIITDAPTGNGDRFGTWMNKSRYRAFELSPYDKTVLLDADLVVASDQINTLFKVDQEILAMRWAYDCTGRRDYRDLNFFGRHSMPSAWATMLYWQRGRTAELVFGMMRMVEEHWQHYKNLYGVTEKKFRNDYALAIALNTVMGHQGKWPEIPWPLATLDDDAQISKIDQDCFEIQYQTRESKPRKSMIKGQDLHVMNKLQIGNLLVS